MPLAADLRVQTDRVAATGTFWYPRVAHAVMEQNVAVARWDPERERFELWTSTQAPHFVVNELAHVFGLRRDQVICLEVAVGGGFGSKSKVSGHGALAAALARKSGRPVRIAYSREKEFAGTKPSHAFRTAVSGELVDLLANGLHQVYLALFGIAIVAALLAWRLTASMPDHPRPAEVDPLVAPSTAAPGRE